MKNIARKIDRLPFWAWPPLGAGAGIALGGVIAVGQLIVGAIAS